MHFFELKKEKTINKQPINKPIKIIFFKKILKKQKKSQPSTRIETISSKSALYKVNFAQYQSRKACLK